MVKKFIQADSQIKATDLAAAAQPSASSRSALFTRSAPYPQPGGAELYRQLFRIFDFKGSNQSSQE
jgi:hypothetical protein